jgi:hypothetical protein
MASRRVTDVDLPEAALALLVKASTRMLGIVETACIDGGGVCGTI